MTIRRSAAAMAPPAKVFVVDTDQTLLRTARRAVAARGWAIEMHATCEAFLATHDPSRPGCLLIDLHLLSAVGLAGDGGLRARGVQLPVVAFTATPDVRLIVRAVQDGALNVLEKPVAPNRLADCVATALAHNDATRTAEARHAEVEARFARLTAREREVVALLLEGRGAQSIARELCVSPKTIAAHRTNALIKLSSRSVLQIARLLAELAAPAWLTSSDALGPRRQPSSVPTRNSS